MLYINKIKNYYYYIVLLLGIILSILWVVFIKTKPISDFNYYNQLATDIANGGFWGDTRQAIGYPITLGFVYWIFGAGIIKAKIFNLILTGISYLLFYYILRKLEIKEIVRKIIFTIFVLFPNNIFYNSILAKEILMTTILLMVTAIYLSKVKYKYIYMGILTGFITIIHASFLVYVLGIFLVELICTRKLKKAVTVSLIILLFTFLTISPLVLRNSKLMGQFTYVSTNSGVVLYINNNSQNNTGGWMSSASVKNSVVNLQVYKDGNRATRCKIFKAAASKWITSHPIRFIQLGIMRLRNTYFAGEDISWVFPGTNFKYEQEHALQKFTQNIRKIVFIPGVIYILFLSVTKIVDLIKNKGNRDSINYKFQVYILMLFYMFSVTQFVTEGQSRYFFPLIFIMVFCFVQLLYNIFSKVQVILGFGKNTI
ncbi:hypothetical protein [Clostridium akagii]|uniref:hypothetical protein n=1 Tax=Clostridium akagii TaxID=91623 RepID=UPI00055E46F9|nr:hypothetical protein [Clostridium akagii]